MSSSVVSLIVQIIAGAIGSNTAALVLRELNLGVLRNTIVGAIGGGIGGQILVTLAPMLATSSGVDIDALASQAVGCGIAGAVVVAIVALIKNKMVAR